MKKLLKGFKCETENNFTPEEGVIYFVQKSEEDGGYIQLDGKKYGEVVEKSLIKCSSGEILVPSSNVLTHDALSETFSRGDAFYIDDNGDVTVGKDCFANAILSTTLKAGDPSSTTDNNIYRCIIRVIRGTSRKIELDIRGYVRYKTNTASTSNPVLLELKAGDIVKVETSCQEERTGVIGLSLFEL